MRKADVPPPLPSPEVSVLRGILAARSHNGERSLAVSGALTRAAQSYAQYMISHNRWAHAANIKVRGFSQVGEILGMTAGVRNPTASVVNDWLNSPIHRPILLSGAFRYFGIGSATGRFQGTHATVWVVRFGR